MAALLSGMIAAMLLAPMSVLTAPTLTVTIAEKSYVDGGPVKPTVKVTGAAGTLTFSRWNEPNCSGPSSKPFGDKPIGANGTVTGPNVNDLTLGKFWLYVWYINAQGLKANACVPYAIQRHSHVFATLPKQQFDVGQPIEPTVTLGTTPDAGGKVDYQRFSSSNCTGPAASVGTSAVANGVVQEKRNYQDGVLGVRSYRVLYSGDARNSAEQSVCRPYAVGAFIRGMVFKDANNNAVLDPGEVGVGGVKLTLKQDGSTVDTVTTPASGVYEFFVIATGHYALVETQPPGYGSSTPNDLDINITGPSLTGKNFGETSGSAAPSASPSVETPQPSPSDTPSESPTDVEPPEEVKTRSVNVLLWVGIGLVLLATVLLLVMIALARRREE